MYVELGYPIYDEMPIYPGLPKVKIEAREQICKGDGWNGSVLSMYLHAGTHADAPWHYVEDAIGIDQIPVESFVYHHPIMITVSLNKDKLITVQDILKSGENMEQADAIFFNTGYWKYRKIDFDKYKDDFPALSPEAAEYIRTELLQVKAVAIDTLSIENLKKGAENGYRTHHALLNTHKFTQRTIVIIEDYNPEPLIGKKIISAFTTPLRIKDRDASPINIFAEVEEI